MKNKKGLMIMVIFLCVIIVGTGVTFAYIVASSREVVNTMTVGDVTLTLTETSGNSFKLLPGVTHFKDPTVTVKAGSLDCWVFIKEEVSADLQFYAEYKIADGWIPLDGEAGVYYRKYYKSATDTAYPIIKDNKVIVYEDLTEQDLEFVHIDPTLTYTAYAVQADMIDTPDDAWDTVVLEKGE